MFLACVQPEVFHSRFMYICRRMWLHNQCVVLSTVLTMIQNQDPSWALHFEMPAHFGCPVQLFTASLSHIQVLVCPHFPSWIADSGFVSSTKSFLLEKVDYKPIKCFVQFSFLHWFCHCWSLKPLIVSVQWTFQVILFWLTRWTMSLQIILTNNV